MTDNFTNTIPTLSMKLLASLLSTGWCIWVLNTETEKSKIEQECAAVLDNVWVTKNSIYFNKGKINQQQINLAHESSSWNKRTKLQTIRTLIMF